MNERIRTRLLIGLAFAITALLLTDCLGGHTEKVKAIIEGRHYEPPYTTISCTTINKTTTCTPIYHPADYTLYVRSWEGLASIDTNAQGYAILADGQAITYSRVRTRWSNYTWGSSYYPD